MTAGDEYLVKWRKINQSTCHRFAMICLILVWYVHGGRVGDEKGREQRNEEDEEMCVCECVS